MKKNALVITTSLQGAASLSGDLATKQAQALKNAGKVNKVQHRHLDAQRMPHLTAEVFAAVSKPEMERTEQEEQLAVLADELINELEQTDIVIVGLPMYNFGVPSVFKSWMDHVARAGRTFRYSANGPEGLLTNKQVIIYRTSGGKYAGTDSDIQAQFVHQFFAFLGITDVTFVYTEGLAMGHAQLQEAVAHAQDKIQELAA